MDRTDASTITITELEADTLLCALREYGPSRMGNHTLYEHLVAKLEAARSKAHGSPVFEV